MSSVEYIYIQQLRFNCNTLKHIYDQTLSLSKQVQLYPVSNLCTVIITISSVHFDAQQGQINVSSDETSCIGTQNFK